MQVDGNKERGKAEEDMDGSGKDRSKEVQSTPSDLVQYRSERRNRIHVADPNSV